MGHRENKDVLVKREIEVHIMVLSQGCVEV